MLAMCIIHYIDGLAWGVVLSIERESRPAVAIILTVPRLNQYNNFKFLNYSIFNLNQ